MRLSHSKLQTILSCPMTYFLNYKEGISLKVEKPALAIGSAVHWGIEHNTDDLTAYYEKNGNSFQRASYTPDQILAEAMVHGYLLRQDNIIKDILTDSETGEVINILNKEEIEAAYGMTLEEMINICNKGRDPDYEPEEEPDIPEGIRPDGEIHELSLLAPLKSLKYDEPHEFIGIIDLLLVTDHGFVLIDYKTSSQTPNWNQYLDQIYRYIFLLNYNFPDIPICKIGIINLRKSQIKQKKNENSASFMKRLKDEYELDDDNECKLINIHIFEPESLDPKLIEAYITNLSIMADTAQMIDNNNLYFINYAEAEGKYGKSKYYDIFYNTADAHFLYNIKDTIFDDDEEKIVKTRECVPIDMLSAIEPDKILNKYDKFKDEVASIFSEKEIDSKADVFKELKSKYTTDDTLLNKYWKTLENE